MTTPITLAQPPSPQHPSPQLPCPQHPLSRTFSIHPDSASTLISSHPSSVGLTRPYLHPSCTPPLTFSYPPFTPLLSLCHPHPLLQSHPLLHCSTPSHPPSPPHPSPVTFLFPLVDSFGTIYLEPKPANQMTRRLLLVVLIHNTSHQHTLKLTPLMCLQTHSPTHPNNTPDQPTR